MLLSSASVVPVPLPTTFCLYVPEAEASSAEAQRTEIVKKIWDYIKKHNCKDPNDGRNIIPDATLGKFLTPPVTMFTMQKQLSAYLEKKAPRAIKNGAA